MLYDSLNPIMPSVMNSVLLGTYVGRAMQDCTFLKADLLRLPQDRWDHTIPKFWEDSAGLPIGINNDLDHHCADNILGVQKGSLLRVLQRSP
jgi:hypothetical protein